MPDITMCRGLLYNDKVICPLREKCIRHISKPDEYQSYFIEAPGKYDKDKFICSLIIKV